MLNPGHLSRQAWDKGREFKEKDFFSYQVHAHGLKFGLYTAHGTHTCQRRPGACQHEAIDAQTYCDWGLYVLTLYEHACNHRSPSPPSSAHYCTIIYEWTVRAAPQQLSVLLN